MTEQFNPGDIVYHKANNLRMVILSTEETSAKCKYVSVNGSYDESNFQLFELTKTPLDLTDIPIISQLATKKNG